MERPEYYKNCEECGVPLVHPGELEVGFCFQCQDIEDQGE